LYGASLVWRNHCATPPCIGELSKFAVGSVLLPSRIRTSNPNPQFAQRGRPPNPSYTAAALASLTMRSC